METIDVIPLLPLLGVNHRQPLLNMSKRLVYLYTTDEHINQFEIGYIINPTLHDNKVFRKKLKMLKRCISSKYHGRYKNDTRKNDTYVIALIMFYENKTSNKIV